MIVKTGLVYEANYSYTQQITLKTIPQTLLLSNLKLNEESTKQSANKSRIWPHPN